MHVYVKLHGDNCIIIYNGAYLIFFIEIWKWLWPDVCWRRKMQAISQYKHFQEVRVRSKLCYLTCPCMTIMINVVWSRVVNIWWRRSARFHNTQRRLNVSRIHNNNLYTCNSTYRGYFFVLAYKEKVVEYITPNIYFSACV